MAVAYLEARVLLLGEQGFCLRRRGEERLHKRRARALEQHHEILGDRVFILEQHVGGEVGHRPHKVLHGEGLARLERFPQQRIVLVRFKELVQQRRVRPFWHDALLIERVKQAVWPPADELHDRAVVNL